MGVPIATHDALFAAAEDVIKRDLRAGVDVLQMDANLIAEDIVHIAQSSSAWECTDAAWSAAQRALNNALTREFGDHW